MAVGTVTTALSAIGATISLVFDTNPTKAWRTNHFFPHISQMLDGWQCKDPATQKKLPIEVDIPNHIASAAWHNPKAHKQQAIADLILIAFYYLFQVGEYTTKSTQCNTKRTVQFRIGDVHFLDTTNHSCPGLIAQNAPAHKLLAASSATLHLDNQKNGWKGVCIHHNHNGEPLSGIGTSNITYLLIHYKPSNTTFDVRHRP